jgi:hypothetical protein
MEPTAVPPSESLRALQERELAAIYSLAATEYALGEEASRVVVALREAGLELDPLTLIALHVMEACLEDDVSPLTVVRILVERGSLARSVEIAAQHLERDAA